MASAAVDLSRLRLNRVEVRVFVFWYLFGSYTGAGRPPFFRILSAFWNVRILRVGPGYQHVTARGRTVFTAAVVNFLAVDLAAFCCLEFGTTLFLTGILHVIAEWYVGVVLYLLAVLVKFLAVERYGQVHPAALVVSCRPTHLIRRTSNHWWLDCFSWRHLRPVFRKHR